MRHNAPIRDFKIKKCMLQKQERRSDTAFLFYHFFNLDLPRYIMRLLFTVSVSFNIIRAKSC